MQDQPVPVAIIGAGPSGLFSAYRLVKMGIPAHLYEGKSGVGRKFLVAGKSGLNLTHSEPVDLFSSRYGEHTQFFKNAIEQFSPNDLRQWCHDLGIETFVGSSGRVFPKSFKAADLLKRWVLALEESGLFTLHCGHKLIKLEQSQNHYSLSFENVDGVVTKKYSEIIFGMGGASWSSTGSDGKWTSLLSGLGVELIPFSARNCGFNISWSQIFIDRVNRAPLKNVTVHVKGKSKVRGEVMLTEYGIEGGAIYGISHDIQEQLEGGRGDTFFMDLKPDFSLEQILDFFEKRKPKESLSKFLKRSLRFDKAMSDLLFEFIDRNRLGDVPYIVKMIKELPIKVESARDIDEAISTAGGVSFSELSSDLELTNYPGVYVAGEMLDFHAPTGGYLLQACFSTAYIVSQAIGRARSLL